MSHNEITGSNLLFDFRALPMRSFEISSKDNKSTGMSIDASAIFDFIDSFISASSVSIMLLAPENTPKEFRKHISKSYRNRVDFLEINSAVEKVNAFLDPVFEETKSSFDGYRLLYKSEDNLEDATTYTFRVAKELTRYLLSLEYGLNLDIDVASLTENIQKLISLLSNNESRFKLSVIEGLLNSYGYIEQPALQVRKIAKRESLDLFTDLVNEDLYISLSEETKNISVPKLRDQALARSKKIVTDISRIPRFKSALKYSVRLACSVLAIPTPEIETLCKGITPPVIFDLSKEKDDALKRWIERGPRPIPYIPDFEDVETLEYTSRIEPDEAGPLLFAKFEYPEEEFDYFIADIAGFAGIKNGNESRVWYI